MKISFNRVIIYLFILLIQISYNAVSLDSAKVMSWNILEYNGQDTGIRNTYFKTVINYTKPDILVTEEMHTQGLANGFLNMMNSSGAGVYQLGIFIDGFDTDNAVFYKPSLFQFISNTPIHTQLRDINLFKLRFIATGDTISLFAVHLKAGNTPTDESSRSAEADSLRKYSNQLPANTNFMIMGDYNIYRGDEPAYIKLTQQNSGNEGYGIDAFILPGIWNNTAYSVYHSQSTRTRSFGGGATGGLDDRFDFILYSKAVKDSGGVRIIPQSIKVIGNDGSHYNDSINRVPNNSVPIEVANALHYSSDHLPVFAKIVFDQPVCISRTMNAPDDFNTIYNYPNPFNSETNIIFRASLSGYYRIIMFDLTGKYIEEIFDGYLSRGWNGNKFNSAGISSGIYLICFESYTTGNLSTSKMIIVK